MTSEMASLLWLVETVNTLTHHHVKYNTRGGPIVGVYRSRFIRMCGLQVCLAIRWMCEKE